MPPRRQSAHAPVQRGSSERRVVLPLERCDEDASESPTHLSEAPTVVDADAAADLLGGDDFDRLIIIEDTTAAADLLGGDGDDFYRLNVVSNDIEDTHTRRRSRSPHTRGRSRNPHGDNSDNAGMSAVSSSVGWLPTRHDSMGAACWELLMGRPRPAPGELVTPALVNMLAGMTFDKALLIVRRRVWAEVRRGQVFYIGITENPDRRWGWHCEGGGQRWESMLVLLQAATSHTSAAMEMALLHEFGSRTLCHNNSAGGEGRSSGSPHFCYMLLGGHMPLRSRR